ncbi:MAG: hypothetical protein WKF37_03630 [Bryobacteraceae bacterium]
MNNSPWLTRGDEQVDDFDYEDEHVELESELGEYGADSEDDEIVLIAEPSMHASVAGDDEEDDEEDEAEPDDDEDGDDSGEAPIQPSVPLPDHLTTRIRKAKRTRASLSREKKARWRQ